MIIELIALAITIGASYYGYLNLVADKLDSPRNNEAIKGLEKEEIKVKIKEDEALKKVKEKEIKDLDKERKEILKGSDADKADKAQEKLVAKEEKQAELKELETNLADLKIVDKGGWKAYTPNKLNLNNGLWVGGALIGLVVLYKVCVGVLSKILPQNWGASNY